MSSASRILELSNIISDNTKQLDAWFTENGKPHPSFAADGPLLEDDFPSHLARARLAVEDATLELHQLLMGPRRLKNDALVNQSMATDTICQANIVHKVPLDDPKGIPYAELSKQTGIAEHALQKVIRLGMTSRVFLEPSPGMVAHSGASKVWATDPSGDDWAEYYIEDGVHMMPYVWEALRRFPEAEEPDRTATAVKEQVKKGGELQSFYQIFDQDPQRATRFAKVMTAFQKQEGFSTRHAADGYDWTTLPEGSIIVDLGGSHGEVARVVTAKYPHLNFIVQDLPETVNSAPKFPEGIPIKFMAHDFMTQQPIKGATAYFFRWIFHNWSDKYGLKMLEALQPALESGSRIIIMDVVVPPMGVLPNVMDKEVRWLDCAMLALFNAGDRTAEQWEGLFKKADPRYKYRGIKYVPGSNMSFIEAVWEP